MAMKLQYSENDNVAAITLDPEDIQVLRELVAIRVERLKRKKNPDIVDGIVRHALEQLVRKLAS